MLKRMRLKNLTVFGEADLRFSSGLNVIIGENGCGKSHLLKTAYAVIAASAEEGRKSNVGRPTKTALQTVYAKKLMSVLRPKHLGRLAKRKQRKNSRKPCELALSFDNDKLNIGFNFTISSKTKVQINQLNEEWHKVPVFFPTRELLTFYPEFASIYANHPMEFDETYRDTCKLLGTPVPLGRPGKKREELLCLLKKAMDNQMILKSEERFYLEPSNQGAPQRDRGKIEIPLVAEGWRKLAMLAYLISNGSLLDPGYLFWDDPETNLNPKLIKVIAEVILLLCNNGIQVFIATHSLFLLRELEILSQNQSFKKIKQRYFSLCPDGHDVQVEQGDAVEDLQILVVLDEEFKQSDRFMGMGE